MKNNSSLKDIKACPFCAEDIKVNAIKCKYCSEWLNNKKNLDENQSINISNERKSNQVSELINNKGTNSNQNNYKKLAKKWALAILWFVVIYIMVDRTVKIDQTGNETQAIFFILIVGGYWSYLCYKWIKSLDNNI